MDIRGLKYFVKLVETGSFSQASKELYITQPALSWNIKKLEESLNVELVERSQGGITITEAGHILYFGAKNILRDIENLKLKISNETLLKRRVLKIGMTILSAIQYMDIFHDFTNRYQEYELDFVQRGSRELQNLMIKKELDFAVVSEPIYHASLLDSATLLSGYYYDVSVVVSKDNPLANKEFVTLEDLRGENFSLINDSFAMGTEIPKRFEEFGIEPNIIFKHENWEVILEHVIRYNTVTLLPTPIKEVLGRDEIEWIPLKDEKISRFQLYILSNLDKNDPNEAIVSKRLYDTMVEGVK